MPLKKHTTGSRAPARPVRVIDPTTNTTYVLVRSDLFEQLVGGLEAFDPRDTYPFIEQVLREDDEQDPTLAGYQGLASAERTR